MNNESVFILPNIVDLTPCVKLFFLFVERYQGQKLSLSSLPSFPSKGIVGRQETIASFRGASSSCSVLSWGSVGDLSRATL